jgi:hypothetical protein
VQTKLPHYTLPLYPALMLLGAAWAINPMRNPPSRWWRWAGIAGLVLVAAGLAAAALAAPWYLERRILLAGLLAIPAAGALAFLLLRAARLRAWGRAGLLGALLAVPLYASILEGVAPHLTPLWIAPRLAEAVEARIPGLPAERFGITGHSEPSVLFALGQDVRLLRTGADAADFLVAGSGRVVAVGDRAEADFRRRATALALLPEEIASVTGFNYSRGRWVTLLVYRLPS